MFPPYKSASIFFTSFQSFAFNLLLIFLKIKHIYYFTLKPPCMYMGDKFISKKIPTYFLRVCVKRPSVHALVLGSRLPYRAALEMDCKHSRNIASVLAVFEYYFFYVKHVVEKVYLL